MEYRATGVIPVHHECYTPKPLDSFFLSIQKKIVIIENMIVPVTKACGMYICMHRCCAYMHTNVCVTVHDFVYQACMRFKPLCVYSECAYNFCVIADLYTSLSTVRAEYPGNGIYSNLSLCQHVYTYTCTGMYRNAISVQ